VKKFVKIIGAAIAVIIVICIVASFADDETGGSESASPPAEERRETSVSTEGQTAGAVSDDSTEEPTAAGQAAGVSPSSGSAAPDEAVLRNSENTEGVLTGGDEFAFGGIEMSRAGEFDPDKKVKVSKSARALRRVVKQDVYGRELPDPFYFYRNLLNENEKKVYDQIYANAAELDPYFEITTKVPYNRLDAIIIAVRYDNPDLFWFDTNYKYTYDVNNNISSVTLGFNDTAKNIDAFKRRFYDCADSALEYVMTFGSDIDKVKYCHDLLTNLNSYAWADYNQSAYSALCTGKTVCAGYSFAFQYLMQRLGIPSAVIYGFAGEKHLWNIVRLDGEWYEMDVTWDDPSGNPPNTYYYNYFNITTGQMGNRRRYEPSSSLPSAGGTYYSYKNYYGSSPGSDFSRVSYNEPGRNLPPVYPGPARYEQPAPEPTHKPEPAPEPEPYAGGDYGDEEEYDDGEIPYYNTHEDKPGDDVYDSAVTQSHAQVEEWLMSLTDGEWAALWDSFAEFLDEDEMEELDEMDWDEFVDLMYQIMN
jgi:hypothetical protein